MVYGYSCGIKFVRWVFFMIFLQTPHQRICDESTICIVRLFKRQCGKCYTNHSITFFHINIKDIATLRNHCFLIHNGCLEQKPSCIPAQQFKVHSGRKQFSLKCSRIHSNFIAGSFKAFHNVIGTTAVCV